MKIRIAKKVLKNPDGYTGQQRYTAAHRIYRAASTFKNGDLGLTALLLKPQRSFHVDDQLDLRLELFLARYNALEEIDFEPGELLISQEALRKPAFRRDGQVQNFNAPKFPTKYHYKSEVVTVGYEVVVLNRAVSDDPTGEERRWEYGEWRVERKDSRKKYQVREGNVAGMRPPRLKRRDYGMDSLTIINRF